MTEEDRLTEQVEEFERCNNCGNRVPFKELIPIRWKRKKPLVCKSCYRAELFKYINGGSK